MVDLGLPDGNGLDLLRGMRAGRHLPVIILTGWAEERERVVGLELGADDYVVKPFSLPELAARIRAVLRRAQAPAEASVHRLGALTVDTRSREVTVNGKPVALTPLEYALLEQLLADAPCCSSRTTPTSPPCTPRSCASEETPSTSPPTAPTLSLPPGVARSRLDRGYTDRCRTGNSGPTPRAVSIARAAPQASRSWPGCRPAAR